MVAVLLLPRVGAFFCGFSSSLSSLLALEALRPRTGFGFSSSSGTVGSVVTDGFRLRRAGASVSFCGSSSAVTEAESY